MVKIDIFFIILGLFLGFFIIYVTTPPPKVVFKYPTIDNIQSTTYVDNNGNCYKYYAKEIMCPSNQLNNQLNPINQNIINPVTNPIATPLNNPVNNLQNKINYVANPIANPLNNPTANRLNNPLNNQQNPIDQSYNSFNNLDTINNNNFLPNNLHSRGYNY
ncbi:hypothetical protein ma520 [Moumouvirus australiensis]|uniref:Uncharacterized protein n=1 Tax=Moumouvirus australiensis TaxID=2109587 RepID=A0A2P1ELY3_9VIRU|nr:hypothetical protein QKC55_gp385 [Moumouvirus australiensis]AVL94906.1 hypothetical protein ma520 [Moumouvirus australiensis]